MTAGRSFGASSVEEVFKKGENVVPRWYLVLTTCGSSAVHRPAVDQRLPIRGRRAGHRWHRTLSGSKTQVGTLGLPQWLSRCRDRFLGVLTAAGHRAPTAATGGFWSTSATRQLPMTWMSSFQHAVR